MMEVSRYYTFVKKILINLITGGMGLVYIVVSSALMKFYTDVVGLTPAAYGVVFLIFSIWNGINDPILGYWADRRPFRPGKGKYAPLIRWAIPVIGVMMFSVFIASPGWNDIFTAVYLLVLLVAYEGFKALLDVSFTAFKINTFLSMKERTQVQVIGTYMSMIPVFLGGMIPVWFLTGEFSRFTIVAIFSGAVAFGLIIAGVGSRYVKEDPVFYEHMEMAQGGRDFVQLFLSLVRNKSFLIFISALILINTATGNYFVGYLYYMDNVLLVEGLKATVPDVLTGVAQMLTLPLIVMAVKKYGSKNVYATGMLIAVAGRAVLSLPINYWIAAATYIVILIGYGFSSALLSPLQGLVIDDIELKTGKRQPGTISGMMSVFMTIAASIQPLILSALLTAAGYAGSVKQQTPEVVRAIRLGTGIIPALILLTGILIFYTLPINHKRELEIQKAMESIHAVKQEETAPAE